MKNYFFIFICFISFSISANDKSASMKLIVKNAKNDKGFIRIALANSKDIYNSFHDVYIGASAEIKNGTSEYIFSNIPLGTYAIKVFHDEDNNKTLNTNFLGIPVEDYGFSNNARALIGIPSWDKAKFELSKDGQEIVIDLN
jgi:uncharacterized protein (DUF2141 family)